jgi:6-phosphogluconolactonase
MKITKLLYTTALLLTPVVAATAQAATYVYVSNADDGDISSYVLADETGKLTPLTRTPAAKLVMPMAASPDGRHLYAVSRNKPFTVFSYRIDAASGGLTEIGKSPLPASMVNTVVDGSGQWLLSASYNDDVLSVHRLGADGSVAAEPTQTLPSGGHKPHSLKTDRDNQFLTVPHLGTDEVRVFPFDPATGKLNAERVSSVATRAGTGPRHHVISRDNEFLYLLGELTGTVTVYKRTLGLPELTQVQTIASLPADTKLVPGAPRVPVGTPGAVAFDETVAIWTADIQMTPDGHHLYTSERTNSTLSRFAVDPKDGTLRFLGLTPTEKKPRGFAIAPSGKYLIASGELSETLSIYRIDPETGDLTLTGQAPTGKGANWVQIVETK